MPYSIGTPATGDNNAAGTSIATSTTITAAAGDTIVVLGTVAGADLTASIAASDGTNTYTLRQVSYNPTQNFAELVAENVAAGTYTVTLSWDGSSRTGRGVYAIPVSGLKSASYQTGAATTQATPGTGTDGITTGNMTPTGQPACVIGAVINAGSLATPAAGTGYTSIGTAWQFGFGTDLMRVEHQRITSTAALALTGTASADVRHFAVAVILTEKITLSAPTATSVTATGATIGATTDQASGTLYVVVDSAANLAGVTASQVKAGQKASGSAALSSGNSAVSTTTPSVAITGLVSGTLYSAAIVQNNTNGDSNLLTTTFTTNAATFEQKHFRWRNDDGSETTATWAAAEDTPISLAKNTPVRLRVEIGATNDPASAAYKLQYRKVGDSTWRDIN